MIALALLAISSPMPWLAERPSPAAASMVAEPNAGAERRISLRIDGEALLDEQIPEAAEETAFFVRTDAAKALREGHGVRVDGDASAPVVVVRLSWESYVDSIYRVRLETVRPGARPQLVESFVCACADSELSAAIVSRFPAALAQLEREQPSEPEPEPAPSELPARETSEPAMEPRAASTDEPPARTIDAPARRTLGRLGRAGIGVAAVGAGALVSGGVLFAQGRRDDPSTAGLERREGLSFRPPGVALMATGSAALLAGAVLLVVDQARPRRAVTAWVLPSPGGMVVTGRF